MLNSPPSPCILGTSVLIRIAQREQDSLKVGLLSAICTTSLSHQLVFRGASALHGVYLHERYSEDLDFFAAPEIVVNAVAAFDAAGLMLEVSWHDELHALMPSVPEFGQVGRGLTHWLPLFENGK